MNNPPFYMSEGEIMSERVHTILCPGPGKHVAGDCQPTQEVLDIFLEYLHDMEYLDD